MISITIAKLAERSIKILSIENYLLQYFKIIEIKMINGYQRQALRHDDEFNPINN